MSSCQASWVTGEKDIDPDLFEDLPYKAQKETGFPSGSIAALRWIALVIDYVMQLDRR